GPTVGQAIEDCIKAAETDATKRAFVTFGSIFGLALYDREQRNVATKHRNITPPSAPAMPPIDEGFDAPQPPAQLSTSQRAAALVKKPVALAANGQDRSALRY